MGNGAPWDVGGGGCSRFTRRSMDILCPKKSWPRKTPKGFTRRSMDGLCTKKSCSSGFWWFLTIFDHF